MNKIFELLDELYENYESFKLFISAPDSINFDDFEEEYQEYGNNELTVTSGATKGVLIESDKDYVIKLPFLDEHEFNFCSYEEYVYNEAISRNLKEFFAETHEVGEYRGIPVYAMKKMEVNTGKLTDIYEEKYKKSKIDSKQEIKEKEIEKNIAFFDGDDFSFFTILFFEKGKEKIRELIEFLLEFDVNDLRYDNIGINEKGEVSFIDYSGYWS